MNSHERMQRESNLVAIIRKKLPEFAKACADDTELVLIHPCWPSREGSPCDREKPKHTARRRENPVTESLQKQVALDKSEGVVKTEISWAVREHRLLCQRRLRTKTLEISPESLCGGVVPPTIDST